jgi:hypothetical protein
VWTRMSVQDKENLLEQRENVLKVHISKEEMRIPRLMGSNDRC